MIALITLILSLTANADCPFNIQSIKRMACFAAPTGNCTDNLYHANGQLAFSKTTKNWFQDTGNTAYSNTTKNMFHTNGKTAYKNTTKNWFHANGKTAYSNTTKNWFHANGKIAYSNTTGTLYYDTGNKAGDYDSVIEYEMLDFIGLNGCN